MRRIPSAVLGRAALAALLVLGLIVTARADDDALRRRVQELNNVTGDDPVSARVKELVSQPETTKKLLAEAATMAEDKGQPLTYNAAYILARAATELKDLQAGDKFYRVCGRQATKLQSTDKLLQSYLGLIDMYFDNKRFDKAAKVCQEVLALKAGDGKERTFYLTSPNRFGDPDFQEFDKFDAVENIHPVINRVKIQVLAKQGKYDQALKLSESLIRGKDRWQDRQLKAWVLREAGRFGEAARAYEDLVERVEKDAGLEQDEKDSYADRYRYTLSNVYVDLKQIDRAAEQLKELIKKHPEEPAYRNDLGYIWADHDMNLPESEKLIRKALELDTLKRSKSKEPGATERENGAYLDSLGWVLFKQKKYKEAKEALQAAVKDKDSQHIEIYDHLGDVHMALGEREAAIQAWRRGVEVAGEGAREKQRRAAVEKKLEKHAK